MKQWFRIVRRPYEEPYILNLIVAAGNGRQQGELEIYSNTDSLRFLSDSLRTSPGKGEDSIAMELGSELPDVHFMFYFRLRIYQIDSRGKCGIELRFSNNRQPPERVVTEFSIIALPADLDRLAAALDEFLKLETTLLEWEVSDKSLL